MELAATEMKIWSTLVKHSQKSGDFVVPVFFMYVFREDLKREGNTGSYTQAYSQRLQQTNIDTNKAPGEMRGYEVTKNRK